MAKTTALAGKARIPTILLTVGPLTMPGKKAAEPPHDFDLNDREWMLKRDWPKMASIDKRMAGDNQLVGAQPRLP
ncbi:hypothetical protein [Nibrella viscosa]